MSLLSRTDRFCILGLEEERSSVSASHINQLRHFDDEIDGLLDDTGQSVSQVRLRLGGGRTLDVAKALDRLWEAGRIERDATQIGVRVGRTREGGELRLFRCRQRLDRIVAPN
jgi:hypothetical protein